jgi:hypothetical protein
MGLVSLSTQGNVCVFVVSPPLVRPGARRAEVLGGDGIQAIRPLRAR